MSALVRDEQSMESNKDFFVTANAVNKPSDPMLTALFTGKQTCYPDKLVILNCDYNELVNRP